jgi:hypothetical protein
MEENTGLIPLHKYHPKKKESHCRNFIIKQLPNQPSAYQIQVPIIIHTSRFWNMPERIGGRAMGFIGKIDSPNHQHQRIIVNAFEERTPHIFHKLRKRFRVINTTKSNRIKQIRHFIPFGFRLWISAEKIHFDPTEQSFVNIWPEKFSIQLDNKPICQKKYDQQE